MAEKIKITAEFAVAASRRLKWLIHLDGSPLTTAGPAKVDLPGLALWSDYGNPGRIIRIEVDAGRATSRDAVPGDIVELQPTIDTQVEAALRRLVGGELVDALSSATRPILHIEASGTARLDAAGRLALLDEYLRHTRMATDGFFATEWLSLAYEAGLNDLVDPSWQEELELAALPILDHVGLSWFDKGPQTAGLVGGVRQVMVSATRASDAIGLSRLARECEALATEEIEDALRDMMIAIPEPAPVLVMSENPSTSPHQEFTEIHELHVDTPVLDVVSSVSAASSGGQIHLDIVAKPGHAPLLRFIDVRVIDDFGVVAASTGFHSSVSADAVRVELPLPADVETDSIAVVVGLGLPTSGLVGDWLETLQQRRLERRKTDLRRTMSAQRASRGEPVEDSGPEPFLAELVAHGTRHLEEGDPTPSLLLALRHDRAIRGDLVSAAAYHLQYVDAGGENDLTEPQLVALAKALCNATEPDPDSAASILALMDD